MLSDTKRTGNLNELGCLYGFMFYGITCSIPYGDASKYDFIADIDGDLIRIQCKSAQTIDENSFSINCVRSTTNTKKTTIYTYSKEEIDYFCTFYDGIVYIIPVEECITSKTLRYKPPKNNNSHYFLAEDYRLDKFLREKYNIINENQSPTFIEEIKKIEPRSSNKDYYCKQCGQKKKSKDSEICVSCSRINSRKVRERPSREELKNMIRQYPFVQIAKQYNVSDNAVRKWCKTYNLPYKNKEIKNIPAIEWNNI